MKKCSKCGKVKSLDGFGILRSSKDGHRRCCKQCRKTETSNRAVAKARYDKKYRFENKDKVKSNKKAYYKTDSGKESNKRKTKRQRAEHPEKYKARGKVSSALQAGTIERQPCRKCGTTDNIQGHHMDYSKPLDVMWLCVKHHNDIHNLKF